MKSVSVKVQKTLFKAALNEDNLLLYIHIVAYHNLPPVSEVMHF